MAESTTIINAGTSIFINVNLKREYNNDTICTAFLLNKDFSLLYKTDCEYDVNKNQFIVCTPYNITEDKVGTILYLKVVAEDILALYKEVIFQETYSIASAIPNV